MVHICKDCPFSTAVWNQVTAWTGEIIMIDLAQALGFLDWWDKIIYMAPRETRPCSDWILYTIWNL